MARDFKKLDKELTKKIEKVVDSPDFHKSREKQSYADKLIKTQKDFRKRNG